MALAIIKQDPKPKMSLDEAITRATYYKSCLECSATSKPCSEDCPTQYRAGNTEEIIEALDVCLEEKKFWKEINVNDLIIEDLEKIKNKLHEKSWTMIGIAQDRQLLDLCEVDKIINDRLSELKGE